MKSIELYSDMFYILDTAYRLDYYHIICNRAHLGEHVYGHIYKKYNATYVYGLEKLYPFLMDNIILSHSLDLIGVILELSGNNLKFQKSCAILLGS